MALHDHDHLTRFLLPDAGVRGIRVHLDDTWQQIVARDDYPAAVAEMLGECAVSAALFTGHAKVDGRLSIQLRSDGAIRSVFAECTAAGTLRGLARSREGAAISRDLRALGPGAILAITIENPTGPGREPIRYQGLVPVETESLDEAFEDYFRQSEQLPTRLLLAVNETSAAGLMLQKLPGDEGDQDGWERACALFDTLSQDELLDLPVQTLLHRLFHQDHHVVLGERALRFHCSCSRERVAAMLEALGQEEAQAAVIAGQVEVHCEFCGQGYRFSQADVDAMFSNALPASPPPDQLQ